MRWISFIPTQYLFLLFIKFLKIKTTFPLFLYIRATKIWANINSKCKIKYVYCFYTKLLYIYIPFSHRETSKNSRNIPMSLS